MLTLRDHGRILELREQGSTYAQIGTQFGVTRQRIQQLLARYGGEGCVCVECGAVTDRRNRLCDIHRAEHEEHTKAKARERARESHRTADIRRERKESGLCASCGKAAPRPGRTECEACSVRGNANSARSYHRRVQDGRCPYCGGERDNRRWKLCTACREKARNYNREHALELARNELERTRRDRA